MEGFEELATVQPRMPMPNPPPSDQTSLYSQKQSRFRNDGTEQQDAVVTGGHNDMEKEKRKTSIRYVPSPDTYFWNWKYVKHLASCC